MCQTRRICSRTMACVAKVHRRSVLELYEIDISPTSWQACSIQVGSHQFTRVWARSCPSLLILLFSSSGGLHFLLLVVESVECSTFPFSANFRMFWTGLGLSETRVPLNHPKSHGKKFKTSCPFFTWSFLGGAFHFYGGYPIKMGGFFSSKIPI